MSSLFVAPTAPASAAQAFSLAAPRFPDLDGKVVGLVENGKFNSDRLLDEIGELLGTRYTVKELVRDRKEYFGRPIPEDHARELAARCDVVITGVGD